ncbi:hypothetical protein LLG95_18885 [bacterium]|nr:hypothetical protein [bacterium]
MKTFLIALACLATAACSSKLTPAENTVLSLVLQSQADKDGRYTVVHPETEIFGLANPADSKEVEQVKKGVMKEMAIQQYDIGPMLDRLFKINRKPSALSLQSEPEKGYVIDYDEHYRSYFKKGAGGWDKFYKENPKAHGMTGVSRPVIDDKNGLVLVYRGTQSHWLAGAGFIILYEFKDGKLKELKKTMLWIS